MNTNERNIYLEDIPIDEAQKALEMALREAGRWGALPAEQIALKDALGRVTAAPVWAKLSSPHYHAAAMDGFAVRANDTQNATETNPVQLQDTAQAYAVNTGDPIPAEMNAVIMIEDVQEHDGTIEIVKPVAPWQHVRMMGEDMVATEIVIPANHVLRPVDIGAIAGCGHHQVAVHRAPRVVIIPTGSELVSAGTAPEKGQLIEYNSLVLSAQVQECGGIPHVLEIVPDDRAQLRAAIQQARAQSPDLILVLSGSSAGSKDYTAKLVQELGQLLVHGVAVRPGHPVILGMVGDVPMMGIPGYPVSAALTGELFMQPLLARWIGRPNPQARRPRLTAQLTRKIVSPIGDDDYVRVSVAQVGERVLATPLSRGAGVITSLVRADGLAHIPRFNEGNAIGDDIDVLLYRDDIQQAIQMMGSHDPMIDLLGQHLALQYPGYRITSAHVGSMGGLVALRRNETHIAGMHMLDEASGEYNLPYIDKQLRNVAVRVVTFAHREQGLIIAKGNPENIQGIDDLPRVTYVNRQRGAGTRLLLDYELKQRNIAPEDVSGYTHEQYTHLGVAAAVATGIADCGLGVRSGALALGLDFVPVGWERYDFVIPTTYLEHPGVKYLLETLNSNAYKADLAQQPGYDTRETGQIVR
jgi:putative molybdopterin biosynthesis protein